MIYKFLKWFAALGIKFYYKNVFIYSKKPLTNNHPKIFASNHPAGFYESLILATLLKRPVIFLVRSDYVNINGLKWLFKILKLHPIYRQTEGLKNVRKNKQVFSYLNDKLKLDAQICIYPEGTTKFQYFLMPIKKGISRLAIGALKDGVKNLELVPIAFNFTEPAQFRSYLTIFSEEPLKLDNTKYSDENDLNNLKDLTSEIKNKMLLVTLHFNNKQRQTIFKKLQLLLINNELKQKTFNKYDYSSTIPEKIKNLSTKIDDLKNEEYNELETKATKYFESISDISDNVVISTPNKFVDYIKIILGFPIYALGIVLHVIPFILIFFLRKTRIKKYEYKAVMTVVIGQFIYSIYFLILLFMSVILFSLSGLIVILIPFLLWFILKYYDFFKDFKARCKFKKYRDKDYIKQQRKDLEQMLDL